eukprot:IDg1177t1
MIIAASRENHCVSVSHCSSKTLQHYSCVSGSNQLFITFLPATINRGGALSSEADTATRAVMCLLISLSTDRRLVYVPEPIVFLKNAELRFASPSALSAAFIMMRHCPQTSPIQAVIHDGKICDIGVGGVIARAIVDATASRLFSRDFRSKLGVYSRLSLREYRKSLWIPSAAIMGRMPMRDPRRSQSVAAVEKPKVELQDSAWTVDFDCKVLTFL